MLTLIKINNGEKVRARKRGSACEEFNGRQFDRREVHVLTFSENHDDTYVVIFRKNANMFCFPKLWRKLTRSCFFFLFLVRRRTEFRCIVSRSRRQSRVFSVSSAIYEMDRKKV